MNLDVDLRFTELFCIVPNEDPDEPYMWTFFLKLDGDTIQQVQPNARTLNGQVRVFSAPGSHDNLGVSGVRSQRSIQVPPQIGSQVMRLRPIPITFLGDLFFVPGEFIAAAVLLEEDNSPSDGIENGHEALRVFIEKRVNSFIQDIDLQEIRTTADDRVPPVGPQLTLEQRRVRVREQMTNLVNERIDALIQEIRDKAKFVVELEVLDAHMPGAIWEWDADDQIDVKTLRFNERSIVNDPGGTNRSILEFMTATDDDEIEAMYRLTGQMNARVQFTSLDVSTWSQTFNRIPVETGRHIFTEPRICISAGQVADWTRFHQPSQENFLFRYPFTEPIWSIEGQAMNAPSGEVRLMKNCAFPLFDPNKSSRPGARTEMREVFIFYERFVQDARPGLRLRNRPEDGNYTFDFQIDTLIGGAPRRVANFNLSFDGQALESPFYKSTSECLNRLFGFAESKKVGPRDLWGPHQRRLWLDEQIHIGEQLVASGIMKPRRFDAAVRVLQRKLRFNE